MMKTKVKKCLLVVVMVFGMAISFGGNRVEASEKVDINSASVEELQRLNGIGTTLAQRIVEARPYKTLDELKSKVTGIGVAKLQAIKDQGLAVAESFPEKVDLNKASLYDLQFLVGVGAPLAQKIIDARPYQSVDELKDKVVGIGEVKLQDIKNQGLAMVTEEKMIKEWFLDANLAAKIAQIIGENVEDIVTPEDFLGVTELVSRDYYSPTITTVEGIQYLVNLERLELKLTNDVSDISNIQNLTNLTKLCLDGGKIKDTSMLVNLKNLYYLDLSNTGLENIDDLKVLENLKIVSLSYNSLTNLDGLMNNKKLEQLMAGHNKITNIDVVSHFENLTNFSVRNNEINSLEPLANLHKLVYLQFEYNHVSSIETLYNLQKIFLIVGYGQTIEVSEQTLASGEKLIVENKIESLDGSLIEPINIEYGGVYNKPNVSWDNLSSEGTKSYKFDLDYYTGNWSKPIFEPSFSGTVTIPYKVAS